MGNRAVITPHLGDSAPSIYLHWNGGRSSVEAFLRVGRMVGIQGLGEEPINQLAALIARYFFETDVNKGSIHRQPLAEADKDNGDNGVYIIDDNLGIIGREHAPREEQYNDDQAKFVVLCICERIIADFIASRLGVDAEDALQSAADIAREASASDNKGSLARVVRRAYEAIPRQEK